MNGWPVSFTFRSRVLDMLYIYLHLNWWRAVSRDPAGCSNAGIGDGNAAGARLSFACYLNVAGVTWTITVTKYVLTTARILVYKINLFFRKMGILKVFKLTHNHSIIIEKYLQRQNKVVIVFS